MTTAENTSGTATWVRTWSASPQTPEAFLGLPATLSDVTLRQAVRISGGGRRIRLRFTNEFGSEGLIIAAARIGLTGARGDLRPDADREITFDGSPGVVIPAGAPIFSDPIDLAVPALATLTLRTYLQQPTPGYASHVMGVECSWVSPGNTTTHSQPDDASTPLPVRALISAVDVVADARTRTVAVLGDSITDGHGSSLDANRRWPDRLAERLTAVGARWCVANQGISGNRLLNPGIGDSALARFDRDILATPGLGAVIVFEGGNDLGVSYAPRNDDSRMFGDVFTSTPVTARDVIVGYQQLIERAHARGVAIYGATLTPYDGTDHYSAAGEKARQTVNDWIRTSEAFDIVFDFDSAWHDPTQPTRIAERFHAGDYLHGNDIGYQTLADCIDLSVFLQTAQARQTSRS